MMEETRQGDKMVVVIVPSRHANGTAISEEKRQAEVNRVSSRMAAMFRGATADDVRTKSARGTYLHEDGTARVVDELVVQVFAKVKSEMATDPETHKEVRKLAWEVGQRLDQETVFFQIGDAAYLVGDPDRESKTHAFTDLQPVTQESLATMAWYRFTRNIDVLPILQLDGWKPQENALSGKGMRAIAIKDGEITRHAWLTSGAKRPSRAWVSNREVGDLVCVPHEDKGLDVYSVEAVDRKDLPDGRGRSLVGPRLLPFSEGRSMSRPTMELVLALLGGGSRANLTTMLDRREATEPFFKAYRAVFQRLSKHGQDQGADEQEAGTWAQRLLGRMMLLRFLEQRGWLEGDHDWLKHNWEEHKGSFYKSCLLPAFSALDSKTGAGQAGLPFLNGGAFSVADQDGTFEVDDDLFDPARKGSLLGLLLDYEFTMNEETEVSQSVSVDPSMFGRALESLTHPDARKEGGVHYTPPEIARSLAFWGITNRLSDRCSIDATRLRKWYWKEPYALSEQEAEKVSRHLDELRILDLAVGSGGLLVACLDVLMDLRLSCEHRLGGDLQRGSLRWRQACQHFVRRCLFGVDISTEAVEVARLRLWMRLAIDDLEPRPLPHLGYNIRVGDSLLEDPADKVLKPLHEKQSLHLPIDQVAMALNDFESAFRRHLNAPVEDAAEARASFDDMEACEARLRAAALKQEGFEEQAEGRVSPFAWRVHFHDVFKTDNRGFDLVIANPPYIRIQSLPEADRPLIRELFESMRGKNPDIYLAFVEKGLELAGKQGQLAYILPNFGHTQSGSELRRILAEGGHVERLIDFRDKYVFPKAFNFTALLFATAEKRRRKTFTAHITAMGEEAEWQGGVKDSRWLSELEQAVTPTGHRGTPYGEEGAPWKVRTRAEQKFHRQTAASRPLLGEIASIGVGIQTSRDEFYLLEETSAKTKGDTIRFYSKTADSRVTLERDLSRPCAKGSKDIWPWWLQQGRHVLWPYGQDGHLMDESELKKYPKTWAYLRRFKADLSKRKGVSKETWWEFGRKSQGIRLSSTPKVLVPALVGPRKDKWGAPPAAALDLEGNWAFTASGGGGGGAYGIEPNDADKWPLGWLAAVLNSSRWWRWLLSEGDPRKDRYRGIDQSILEKFPMAAPRSKEVKTVVKKMQKMQEAWMYNDLDTFLNYREDVDEIVECAYKRTK